MSSYKFDGPFDEIEFWQDRTKMLEIDIEVLQAEVYELDSLLNNTEAYLFNIIALNSVQAPLSEIDIALDNAVEFLQQRKVKDA